MVLLTMTTLMVEVLEKLQSLSANEEKNEHIHDQGSRKESSSKAETHSEEEPRAEGEQAEEKKQSMEELNLNTSIEKLKTTSDEKKDENSTDPSLQDPKIGNPISHGQVIDLWKQSKAKGLSPSSLEDLLRGSRVYIPPPPPKKEPVSLHSLPIRATSFKQNWTTS